MFKNTRYIAIAKDSGDFSEGFGPGFNKTKYFTWLRDAVQWLRKQREFVNGTFSYEIRECGPEIDLDLDDKDYD